MSYIQRANNYVYESIWPTPEPQVKPTLNQELDVKALLNAFVSSDNPVGDSALALKKTAEAYFFSLDSQTLVEHFLSFGRNYNCYDNYDQPQIERAKIFLERIKEKEGFNLLEKLDKYDKTLLEVIFKHLIDFDIPDSYSYRETHRSAVTSLVDDLSSEEFDLLYPILLECTAQKHLKYAYEEDNLTTYLTLKISPKLFSSFENLNMYYKAVENDLDDYSFSYRFLGWNTEEQINSAISESLEKCWIADSKLSIQEAFKALQSAPVMQLFISPNKLSGQAEQFDKMITCLKGILIKKVENLFSTWFEASPGLFEERIIELIGCLKIFFCALLEGSSSGDIVGDCFAEIIEKKALDSDLTLENLSTSILEAAFSLDFFDDYPISSEDLKIPINIKNVLNAARSSKNTIIYTTFLDSFLSLMLLELKAQFDDVLKISLKDCQSYLASYDIDYDLLLDFNVKFLNGCTKNALISPTKRSKSKKLFKEQLLEEFLIACRGTSYYDYDSDYEYDSSYGNDQPDSSEIFRTVFNSLEDGDHKSAADTLERIRYRYYNNSVENSSEATAALFKGIEKSNIVVVKQLIEIGCSPLAENTSGKSALAYAKELNRSPWFIQYLEEKVKELKV